MVLFGLSQAEIYSQQSPLVLDMSSSSGKLYNSIIVDLPLHILQPLLGDNIDKDKGIN